MRDDPFYLFKAFTLKASLGVLSVDGNFGKSIAYLQFFVKFRLYAYLKKAYVGGDCYHIILTSNRQFNLTYFSQKLFFNVKMIRNIKR